MEIPRTAIIILGCLALVLFIALVGHLIYKVWEYWRIRRGRFKYHLISDKYSRKQSKVASPKFSINFPTTPVFLQLSNKHIVGTTEEKKVGKLKERRRKYGIAQEDSCPLEKEWHYRRNRRVHSESDISMFQNHVDNKKEQKSRRAKSELEVRVRPRRVTSQSTLRVVSEVGGELEFTTFYHSVKNLLVIKITQVFDVSEIMPELFADRCDVVDVDSGEPEDQPYLVRQKNGMLTFSDLSQLGLAVEVMKYPRKEHVGTTDYQFGLQNPTFNETFTIHCRSSNQFFKMLLRFQVVLRYGRLPQMPVIIGETVLPARDCRQDTLNTFRQHLKHPMEEKELESSADDQIGSGQMTISVRYQLLRHLLTVRIVDASYTTKFGIQQPSTSVKIGVYMAEERVYRQVSDVIKRTTNPQFNKTFDFDVPLERLVETGILIEVRNHSTVQRNTLGFVHIGTTAKKPACDYWKEVLAFSDFNSECVLDITTNKPTQIC